MSRVILLNKKCRTSVYGSLESILKDHTLTEKGQKLSYNQVARRMTNGKYDFDGILLSRKEIKRNKNDKNR